MIAKIEVYRICLCFLDEALEHRHGGYDVVSGVWGELRTRDSPRSSNASRHEAERRLKDEAEWRRTLTIHLPLIQTLDPITRSHSDILLELKTSIRLDEIGQRDGLIPRSGADGVGFARKGGELKEGMDPVGKAC